MTALDENDDPLDSQLLQRIVDLNLESVSAPVASPPRTPLSRSPPPYVTSAHHSSLSSTTRPTVYEFASPTRHGFTTEWSTTGSATQNVTGGHVRTVQRSTPKKKKTVPPEAYVVFCGIRCGVFRTWAETRPLVLGVSSNIYRGYPTMAAAHAAFAYAEACSWTRVCGSPLVTAIPSLPAPLLISEINNPLHASETLDDRWYIVYRGIRPGVYHTHLESQLNVLGVPGALHESVAGKVAALEKYNAAARRGHTGVVNPAYHVDASADPFL
ncbi:hypothetical protein B0H14DRAFT_3436420 [Mycena olivaceomarginata]|nr:hypothetical protein B0H14DRAFT_3436420 [Mycena olivaceomarginata]